MKNSLIILMIFSFISFSSGTGGDKEKKILKTTANDFYNTVAVNQIKMWISNNGDGSHDPITDGSGFYWPGGQNSEKTAIFEDGLIFGGIYNGDTRVNGNTHRAGLHAGKILPGGIPDDPMLEKYRVYKILKGWQNLPPGPLRDQYELDYNEWPILDGAPFEDVDGNGIPNPGVDLPKFIGDETAWYVANDMDSIRSTLTYGTLPMGLEFQTTVWADSAESYQDIIFKKYLMINKSDTVIEDMYVAYWSDTDLGDANDDYTGCDSMHQFGYTWNADNQDGSGEGSTYGMNPPAVGYDLLQGPIVPSSQNDSARFLNGWRKGYRNLPMTSFVLYINTASYPWRDPQMGTPAGSVEFYNYLQGFVWDGSEFVNPHTLQPTKFVLTGDPVTQTGWYEGDGWPGGPIPGDRRHVMSSGPFTMAPGDTQEIMVGIVIARGSSNINSITELKLKDQLLQNYYDNNYIVSEVNEPTAEFDFQLQQNYPNPFNPSTKITFSLPNSGLVTLKVYDILGNEVSLLINENKNAGVYSVDFDGSKFSSGVYFYQVSINGFVSTKKMMLLK